MDKRKNIFQPALYCVVIFVSVMMSSLHAQVRLELEDSQATQGVLVQIPLTLDRGGEAVSAVAAELFFDPDILTEASVEINPVVAQGTSSDRQLIWSTPRTGLLKLALIPATFTDSSLTKIIKDGVVATISFRVNNSALSNTTTDISIMAEASDSDGKALYVIGRDANVGIGTAVDQKEHSLPSQFVLYENYPNPFNVTTTFRYDLPRDAHIEIGIYNILGNQVSLLVNEKQKAGHMTVSWDGRNDRGMEVSSGIYLCIMRSGQFTGIRKLVLIK